MKYFLKMLINFKVNIEKSFFICYHITYMYKDYSIGGHLYGKKSSYSC